MPASDCRNLFLAARIQRYDQERFVRCLDALVAEERLDVADILGVGAVSKNDLYVVQRDAVHWLSESGVFKKQVTVRRVCSITSIANLHADQEIQKRFEFYLIAEGVQGEQLFRIVWPLQLGDELGTEVAARQRKHLFEVISSAMDRFGAMEAQATADQDCPCGNGSLTTQHLADHVVDLKTTHGVEALTYDCPVCGYVEGELWNRTEEGRAGTSAGLYVHLHQSHGLS